MNMREGHMRTDQNTAPRPGYKLTKLGWIPEEWEVRRLKDIGKITSGSTPLRSKEVEYFQGGTIPWVKTTDLNNSVIFTTEEKITELALSETACKKLPVGTILVAMYGGFNQIGRTGVLAKISTTNQALSAIIPNQEVTPSFVLEWLNLKIGYWKRFAASSRKDPNITKKDVGAFPLPLPPLAEQRKIAAILSTWDRAIGQTEALLAQLRLRNRGLAQQLLTGETRVAGFENSTHSVQVRYGKFPADWRYTSIATFASEVKKKNTESTDLPVLSCTKYDGLVDSLQYFGKRVFSEDTSGYKVVKQGQFAYATNHIEEGSIGYQNLYPAGLISPMYTAFKTDRTIDDAFLFRLLKTDLLIHLYQVNTSSSVDRRGSLRWKEFSKIKVFIPPLPEQQAIARILQAADAEVVAQEARLTALREQKRGLMQGLLTGAVRVKINE